MNLNAFTEGEHEFLLEEEIGVIEAIINVPKGVKKENTMAIVCHPHPLFGGTMRNKVAHTLAKVWNDVGITALRFNFRGVGKSTGCFDNGLGESEDLIFLANLLQSQGFSNLCLSGFSFGSYVCLRALHDYPSLPVTQLITVAPAVTHFSLEGFTGLNLPWLIAQGEEDEVVAAEAVFQWAENLNPAPKIIRFPQTGHFFHGKIIELRNELKEYLISMENEWAISALS